MPITPLFLARCDSLLHYIGFYGRVELYNLDDQDVAEHLMRERKVSVWHDEFQRTFLIHNASSPYTVSTDKSVHPVVLELAADNPANEELMIQYRKNTY
jgi:hypothetical protein